MANWLRGVIHLRGSKQSIRKFILNLIDPDDLEAANVNENSLCIKTTSHIGFHIKDTCGNYIDSYEVNINFSDATLDEYGNYILSMDFASCGTLDVEGMCSLSQSYLIDFAIDIYDAWIGITQDICIINGSVVRHNVTQDDSR